MTNRDFDFSANGKYLASCCGERSIIVWHTNEFESKDHKAVRGSFDYDNAHKICFAPDSISLIACMEHDYEVAVHKLAKKDSSTLKIVEIDGVKFPYGDLHKNEVISMGVSVNGKYLMTASSDTTVVIRDLKGNVLKVLDSKLGNNYCTKISHCGRFVGCSGFTPDVKVWEVEFARNDEFKDVTRAFDLKGHSSGIRSFDFNQDSTLMVSASKDGTFRVWNTDIKYKLGQEPYLLLEKPCDELKRSEYVSVALSPNGEVVALALDKIVKMFCAQSGDCLGVIKQDPLNNVPGLFSVGPKFSADGKFILLALNRQILIFHNVPGYRTSAKFARDLAKKATSAAHKERLQQQADEAELAAAKFPTCE
uniref:Transducin beta-like protein 2 n=1 Tax=Romanomermis culicivorax TaxID=13658 RepID=A0A915L9H3_ROMCU